MVTLLIWDQQKGRICGGDGDEGRDQVDAYVQLTQQACWH
jgi:hypothetical protein